MGLCLGVACKRSLCSEHPGKIHTPTLVSKTMPDVKIAKSPSGVSAVCFDCAPARFGKRSVDLDFRSLAAECPWLPAMV
jgi:hypothetical protein